MCPNIAGVIRCVRTLWYYLTNMNFAYSSTTQTWITRLDAFLEEHISPFEREYTQWTEQHPWQVHPRMAELKAAARAAGLWNLFLPKDYGEFSPGLTNLEYEIGRASCRER